MLTVQTSIGASKIHGIGLFASQPIRAGTTVWTYDPRIDQSFTGMEDFPGHIAVSLRSYCFVGLEEQMILCGDDARFMNFPEHDEEANTKTGKTMNSEYDLIAARDILIGEEITVPLDSDADAAWKLEE